MLVCKACNTRFGPTMAACPNCGRRAADHAVEEGPGASGSGSLDTAPLPPAPTLQAEENLDLEVELEEVAVVAKPKPRSASAPSSHAAPKPAAAPARAQREPGPMVFHLNPSQVRTLIAEQPELVEPGLGVHTDESGKAVGAHFPSPVGEIHLLARDKKGSFVVIMVPDPGDPTRIVPDVLQRMGWVRKHIAGGGKEVRGVVVLEQLPEEVAYAAAGAAGSLRFKAFRVALTFHDLEV